MDFGLDDDGYVKIMYPTDPIVEILKPVEEDANPTDPIVEILKPVEEEDLHPTDPIVEILKPVEEEDLHPTDPIVEQAEGREWTYQLLPNGGIAFGNLEKGASMRVIKGSFIRMVTKSVGFGDLTENDLLMFLGELPENYSEGYGYLLKNFAPHEVEVTVQEVVSA